MYCRSKLRFTAGIERGMFTARPKFLTAFPWAFCWEKLRIPLCIRSEQLTLRNVLEQFGRLVCRVVLFVNFTAAWNNLTAARNNLTAARNKFVASQRYFAAASHPFVASQRYFAAANHHPKYLLITSQRYFAAARNNRAAALTYFSLMKGLSIYFNELRYVDPGLAGYVVWSEDHARRHLCLCGVEEFSFRSVFCRSSGLTHYCSRLTICCTWKKNVLSEQVALYCGH